MRTLTSRDFNTFITSRPVVVIHVDAAWDTRRDQVRAKMLAAEKSLKDFAAFAEVDCDAEGHLCKSLGVANIPCIAWFREGKQACLRVGAHHDIHDQTQRILDGTL